MLLHCYLFVHRYAKQKSNIEPLRAQGDNPKPKYCKINRHLSLHTPSLLNCRGTRTVAVRVKLGHLGPDVTKCHDLALVRSRSKHEEALLIHRNIVALVRVAPWSYRVFTLAAWLRVIPTHDMIVGDMNCGAPVSGGEDSWSAFTLDLALWDDGLCMACLILRAFFHDVVAGCAGLEFLGVDIALLVVTCFAFTAWDMIFEPGWWTLTSGWLLGLSLALSSGPLTHTLRLATISWWAWKSSDAGDDRQHSCEDSGKLHVVRWIVMMIESVC